jgi:hypothetical protein
MQTAFFFLLATTVQRPPASHRRSSHFHAALRIVYGEPLRKYTGCRTNELATCGYRPPTLPPTPVLTPPAQLVYWLKMYLYWESYSRSEMVPYATPR